MSMLFVFGTMVEFAANLLYQRRTKRSPQSQKKNEIGSSRTPINPICKLNNNENVVGGNCEIKKYETSRNCGFHNLSLSSETIDFWAFILSAGLYIVFNFTYFSIMLI